MRKAVVIRALAGFFYVKIDGELLECKASKKLKMNKKQIIVGDYVDVDTKSNYITSIFERENSLIRPKIANVHNAFLVFSIIQPKMNYGLLDRMLLTMEMNNVNSTIIVSKMDLANDEIKEKTKKILMYYENIGYKVIYSDFTNDPKEIKELLESDKYVITGQTGVGKSTLINKLLPNLNLQTQEISKALNRGKHTTREVTFYELENSFLIDTPGFSSLEINFTKEDIRDNYVDFTKIANDCKFNGCYHINEPKCKVKEFIEEGRILKSRYEHYKKFMELAKDEKWKKK